MLEGASRKHVTPCEDYAEHASVLVAEVDCIGAGRSKCDDVGVEAFPTLKLQGLSAEGLSQ